MIFENHVPGAVFVFHLFVSSSPHRMLKLEQNYQSTQKILSVRFAMRIVSESQSKVDVISSLCQFVCLL